MHNELLEHEIERARSAEEFWLAFMESLHRVGLEHVSHGESDAAQETDRLITLKMADQSSWHLRYKDDSMEPRYWVRIAKCLQGAYSNGVRSWGHCRTPSDPSKDQDS